MVQNFSFNPRDSCFSILLIILRNTKGLIEDYFYYLAIVIINSKEINAKSKNLIYTRSHLCPPIIGEILLSLSMDKPREIRMIVFSALLTALNELMGRDGKNSILRYAGLDEYINQEVPPSVDESISFDIFRRLISSMQELLGHGTHAILYESGRKFAIYLTPFGYSLQDVVRKLANWFGGNIIINVEKDNEEAIIQIKNNPFCLVKEMASELPSCHLISGALAQIKEESTGDRYIVTEMLCESKGDSHCEFHIFKRSSSEVKKDD